jgi:hypothetical protein
MFLHTFQDCDYDKVCLEPENLCRFKGAYFEDFLTRFKLICLKFQSQYLPSRFELMGWFRHIVYLPCISNRYDEHEDTTFLSLFTVFDAFFESTSDMDNPV